MPSKHLKRGRTLLKFRASLSQNHSLPTSISQLNQKGGPMEVVLFGQRTGKKIEMSVDARYRSRNCSIQKIPPRLFHSTWHSCGLSAKYEISPLWWSHCDLDRVNGRLWKLEIIIQIFNDNGKFKDAHSQKKFLVLKDVIKVLFWTKGYSRENKGKFCF